MAEYKYILFEEVETKGKTRRFNCLNKKSNFILGEVIWVIGWRQYCFFPSGDTQFSVGCLNDVIDFIQKLKSS
jgi:hypothetical protein